MRHVIGRYLAPAAPERLAGLRILVGGYALTYLLIRLPHLLSISRFDDDRFDPVGPLWFLSGPVPAPLGRLVLLAALVTGAAFVAGWRWTLSGPSFAVLFLAVTTYRSSWGQVFHTENLVALHLLVLALSPAGDVWALDRRRHVRPVAPMYGWPVRLCSIATVLAYLVSGWAKVRNGGVDWVTGDVLRNQVAHDNLRKALMGDIASPLGTFALRFPWLFPPMAAVSLATELGAVLALLGGRLRVVWLASVWLFHAGVLALMAILFPYQLTGVAFASLLPIERWPPLVAIGRRLDGATTAVR